MYIIRICIFFVKYYLLTLLEIFRKLNEMKPLVILAIIVGMVLLIVSGFYFSEPAKALPAFFPGHEAGVNTHHYKHGIGVLILGLACFAFAWFQSGKKKSNDTKTPTTTQ